MTNTFPRQVRLLTARDYRGVFSQVAYRVPHRNLLLLATPNRTGHARIGLIVSKKNVRKAIARNRFKRLVRESFRNRRETLPAVDIVVLARPGVNLLDNAQLYALLDKAWRRLDKAIRQQSART